MNTAFIDECKRLWEFPRLEWKSFTNNCYFHVLKEQEKLLNTETLRQLLWHILHEVNHIPSCRTCTNELKFNGNSRKYPIYCSKNCEKSDPKRTEFLQEKLIRTKETNIKKYGVDNPLKNDNIKEKIINTNIKKYGVDNPFKSTNIQHKAKDTMMKRYGAEHALQIDEFKEKILNTTIEKYGVKNVLLSTQIQEKIKQTNIIKYGAYHASKQHIDKSILELLQDEDKFKKLITGRSSHELIKEFGISPSTFHIFVRKYSAKTLLLPPNKNSFERLIAEILDSNSISYEFENKSILSGKELDFYIPQHNLAIEVGAYHYHLDKKYNDPLYHQTKWNNCLNQNITLLQYFDKDLDENINLIESKILRMCGISVPVIGARKCTLGAVSNEDERTFLKEYHIQGPNLLRNWKLGAYYNNELVALMSIYVNGNEAKLIRWCTKIDSSYSGLFSRMLSNFKKTGFSGRLETFSNNFYGNGKVYDSSGFRLDHVTAPGMFYYKNNTIEHREKYQKHKLHRIFKLSDEELKKTADQIMQDNGYTKFYDAGHTKWILDI